MLPSLLPRLLLLLLLCASSAQDYGPGSVVQEAMAWAFEAGSSLTEMVQSLSGQSRSGVAGDMGSRETTVQLIEAVGLQAEEHTVETDDGYILTLHRIVSQDRGLRSSWSSQGLMRPAIFLQHGLLASSADWCIGARDKALGFLLADAGYDVWLGNFRGNSYSKQHRVMAATQREFWQWSFDQMGQQDLPAMLDKVLAVTSHKQLTYIGHSMGTMAFWVMMNARPWMNANVRLMVGLAPIATVALHPASPLHIFVPMADQLEGVLSFTGQYEFFSRDSLITDLKETSFSKVYSMITGSPTASGITKDIYLTMAPQADLSLLPVVMRHTPAGTSSRTLLHFAQGVRSGKFLPFVFPTEQENRQMYGTDQPQEYDLKEVTCPVLLYWGEGDWLSQPRGVAAMAKLLPNLVKSVRVPHENWNHLDFLWGRDAASLLYSSVIKAIETFDRVAQDCDQCQQP